ncbi:protein shisa-like-1 isoform X7 [Caretta caretta]|uniref:protein shisa-like-1 isoform X7 n=1 Tax=Caretta caretta TaxID=8467 RepID=UPI003F4BAE76
MWRDPSSLLRVPGQQLVTWGFCGCWARACGSRWIPPQPAGSAAALRNPGEAQGKPGWLQAPAPDLRLPRPAPLRREPLAAAELPRGAREVCGAPGQAARPCPRGEAARRGGAPLPSCLPARGSRSRLSPPAGGSQGRTGGGDGIRSVSRQAGAPVSSGLRGAAAELERLPAPLAGSSPEESARLSLVQKRKQTKSPLVHHFGSGHLLLLNQPLPPETGTAAHVVEGMEVIDKNVK